MWMSSTLSTTTSNHSNWYNMRWHIWTKICTTFRILCKRGKQIDHIHVQRSPHPFLVLRIDRDSVFPSLKNIEPATLPTHNGMIFSSESIIPYQCINCCTTSWLINSPISSDSRWDIKIDIETCWWLASFPIKWNIKVRANQLTVLWVNFVHVCWIVLTCNN